MQKALSAIVCVAILITAYVFFRSGVSQERKIVSSVVQDMSKSDRKDDFSWEPVASEPAKIRAPHHSTKEESPLALVQRSDDLKHQDEVIAHNKPSDRGFASNPEEIQIGNFKVRKVSVDLKKVRETQRARFTDPEALEEFMTGYPTFERVPQPAAGEVFLEFKNVISDYCPVPKFSKDPLFVRVSAEGQVIDASFTNPRLPGTPPNFIFNCRFEPLVLGDKATGFIFILPPERFI